MTTASSLAECKGGVALVDDSGGDDDNKVASWSCQADRNQRCLDSQGRQPSRINVSQRGEACLH